MKKKVIFGFSLIALVLSAVLFTGGVAAWFFIGDYIKAMKFSVLKIDSTVTMYQAVDSNRNGIPDLLDTPAAKGADDYYSEKYSFTKIGTEYAQSTDPASNLVLTDSSATEALPSQTFTYKFALVNNSDASNILSFRYDASAYGESGTKTEQEKLLLSVMSARLGVVTADELDEGRVTFYEKKYFGKDMQSNILSLVPEGERVEIAGGFAAQGGVDNRKDFWLQLEMEPYELLPDSIRTHLTQAQYNALAQQSLTQLYFRIYFEVEYSSGTSASDESSPASV